MDLVISVDSARPKLRTDIDEMGEYINAVYVNVSYDTHMLVYYLIKHDWQFQSANNIIAATMKLLYWLGSN